MTARSTENGDYLLLTPERLNVQSFIDYAQRDDGGAIATFLGTTRNNFQGKEVLSLHYEAYEDMALDSLEAICSRIREKWDVLRIAIGHKLGSCPVGDVSVMIAISSEHRAEALQAVDYCINDLKANVPIWKKEIYGGDWEGHGVWKKNKEFEPKVPAKLLSPKEPTTRNGGKGAVTGAADSQKSAKERVAVEMKKKLRLFTCDEVDGQRGRIILALLDAAFDRASCIDEVGTLMLPLPPGSETTSVDGAWEEQVQLVECGSMQKLGIGMHCMKPLFAHAATRLGAAIEAFKADPGDVEKRQSLLSLSRAIVLVRGDMPSALNARKEVLLTLTVHNEDDKACRLKHVEAELQLIAAIFTLHPKSPSGWHHRRWCLSLRHLLKSIGPLEMKQRGMTSDEWLHTISSPCTIPIADPLGTCCGEQKTIYLTADELDVERSLCRLVNERYTKNYYGWLHRLWLLRIMAMYPPECPPLDIHLSHQPTKLLQVEVDEVHAWLQNHVSDHCAINHQHHATVALLEVSSRKGSNAVGVAVRQLCRHRELVKSSPGHESLWYGQRSLVMIVLSFFAEAGLVVEDFTAGISAAIARNELDMDGPSNLDGSTFTTFKGDESSILDAALFTVISEIQLVRYCRQDTSAWDFQLQRTLAGRAAANLYSQLSVKFPALSASVLPLLRRASQSLLNEDSLERHWADLAST